MQEKLENIEQAQKNLNVVKIFFWTSRWNRQKSHHKIQKELIFSVIDAASNQVLLIHYELLAKKCPKKLNCPLTFF